MENNDFNSSKVTKRPSYNPKAHSPAVYIPCWLIQVSTDLLSNAAKILYGRLAQWSSSKGTVHRSINQLCEELGMLPRAIERILKELRDVKLICTYQVELGGVNHYQFLEHEWMNIPINENLEYKNTNTPPVKNDGTPPSKMTVPPVKNDGAKIKEIKVNKKSFCAPRGVEHQKIKNNSNYAPCPMADVTKQSTSYNPNKETRQEHASPLLEDYMKSHGYCPTREKS